MTIRRLIIPFALALSVVMGISACSDDPPEKSESKSTIDASDSDRKPAPTPSFSDKDKGKTDKALEYTDPSKAGDYCGVLKNLETFNEETLTQTESASLKQVGDRLEILERTARKLSEYSESKTSKSQWSTMANDTKSAVDFYKSAGGQAINDDFLVLMAKAYDSSAKAYEGQRDAAKKQCDVDLDQFLLGGGE